MVLQGGNILERKAVVLLSGGLDSATTLYIAREEGFRIHTISFHYGQQHTQELESAAVIAKYAGARDHVTISLDPRLFEGSALTGSEIIPENRSPDEMAGMIPSTYVPARNTVFLAMALAYAEVIGARDIFIGVNALDYSGYPDCRPEFVAAFQKLAELATKEAVDGNPARIHAPLLYMTKAEIIKQGLELGVDYSMTHSCYNPDKAGRACGRCDACILRLRGFHENGIKDPAIYINQSEMNNEL
ncbi:MAG: 7-cyano-7-deazaguanine synthase QueC [Candidatus Aegiribacteria sp.]|nr:7-cyano-7-deazaguanine synthase QueC [Candidatus Aegiribacteria sp.]